MLISRSEGNGFAAKHVLEAVARQIEFFQEVEELKRSRICGRLQNFVSDPKSRHSPNSYEAFANALRRARCSNILNEPYLKNGFETVSKNRKRWTCQLVCHRQERHPSRSCFRQQQWIRRQTPFSGFIRRGICGSKPNFGDWTGLFLANLFSRSTGRQS